MVDDMGLPPMPEGEEKQNGGPALPDFPSEGADASGIGFPSMDPSLPVETPSMEIPSDLSKVSGFAAKTETDNPFLDNSFFKAPVSLQREKDLADKLITTQSSLQKKELEINEVKEKLQRELEESRIKFDAQKQELKKEIDTYRQKLEKDKEQWSKVVTEKENEVRRIRDTLNNKDQLVNDKIIEVETELKSKMSREHSRLAEEKKYLEKKNTELESRLKEIEGGWKKKEQEVRDLQEKALNELRNAEEKLQEEREKTWLKTLKAKEDEINSMKVEITLQESKIRAVLEKKQDEVRDIEEKTGRTIKDKTEKIGKEKENILEVLAAREKEINTLKEAFADREKYLAGKVEDAEMDGKLALAKFDQELKEREKNLWVEREEWITVLKAQFKEKERELKEQLEKERISLAGEEQELKGAFEKERTGLKEQLEKERVILKEKELELKEAFEKEKAGLKEKENSFGHERDKLLELLNAKDGEIKAISNELKTVLDNREKEFEALRKEISIAAKIKETELLAIRQEYSSVTEGRDKEIEVLKSEIRNVLSARDREVAATKAEARALLEKKEIEIKVFTEEKDREIKEAKDGLLALGELKEKEKAGLVRDFLDKEAELRRKAYELEARALDAVKKVSDNDELWKQRITLKEAELTALKSELSRQEAAFNEAFLQKGRELKEFEETFLAEKAALAEKLSLKDYEFSSEIAKKEQVLASLEEKIKESEGVWQSRLEQQKKQLYDRLSEKDESAFKQMEENRLLIIKLKTEEDELLRKEQEYRFFISQYEEKEKQYKKLLEEQILNLRKLEEDRAADFGRTQERLKNLENTITEKDNEKRRLETELNIRNGVIFEKEEKLRELELFMRRLEHDKQLLSEDLERSRAEVNRVKEGTLYELSGLKEDNERLQKALAEKSIAIESLRSTLFKLNEESANVEREYNVETSGKAALLSELERVKVELKVLKEQGQSGNLSSQMKDKDTIIISLNDTISKIEKEKAAIKELILEKSKAEETKDKELKDLMYTVSNLTEDKNKFEFKTKELESDRENALNELNIAQKELIRLQTEADTLKLSYEEKLDNERNNLGLEIERVKRETEEFSSISCLQFDTEKNRLLQEIDSLKAELITTGNVLDAVKKENQMKLEEQKRCLEEELNNKVKALADEKEEIIRNLTEEINRNLEEKETSAGNYEERLMQLKEEIDRRDVELNRIKSGIDSNLSKLDEQNRYIEELKNEVAAAGDNLRSKEEETAAVKEIIKNKEVDNQKLQVELGGLLTRSDELSKLAGEKDNQINNLTQDFNGKLEALAEVLKVKERDLETAKEKAVELENRIKNDYEMKEEELKLAIGRLQMQLKEITGRHETELKAEKQKLQSIQAEYALREAQWSSQKDKEKETRGQMADMEASYMKLKKDSSDNTAKFTSELESAQLSISAFEVRIRESEEKIQKLDKENDVLADQLMKETEEKEKLLKIHMDIESRLKVLSVSLKDLRKRFKFVLWLWYPNEPRN